MLTQNCKCVKLVIVCDLGMTFKNYVENFELSMTNIQEFTFLKQTTNMISLFLCAGLLTLYAALKSHMCTENP